MSKCTLDKSLVDTQVLLLIFNTIWTFIETKTDGLWRPKVNPGQTGELTKTEDRNRSPQSTNVYRLLKLKPTDCGDPTGESTSGQLGYYSVLII